MRHCVRIAVLLAGCVACKGGSDPKVPEADRRCYDTAKYVKELCLSVTPHGVAGWESACEEGRAEYFARCKLNEPVLCKTNMDWVAIRVVQAAHQAGEFETNPYGGRIFNVIRQKVCVEIEKEDY